MSRSLNFITKAIESQGFKCESGVIKLIERPVAVAAEGNWRIV